MKTTQDLLGGKTRVFPMKYVAIRGQDERLDRGQSGPEAKKTIETYVKTAYLEQAGVKRPQTLLKIRTDSP